MKKRAFLAIFILLLMACVVSCDRHEVPAGDPEEGASEKGVYSNKYFGFTIQMPSVWEEIPTKTMKKETEAALKDKAADTSKVFYLFSFFEKPKYQGASSCGITCVAEQLGGMKSMRIKNGKDYLEASKENLKQTLKCKFPKDVYFETINGVEYYVLEADMSVNSVGVKELFYVTIKKEHALIFTLAYGTNNNAGAESKLKKVMRTVKFSDK